MHIFLKTWERKFWWNWD